MSEFAGNCAAQEQIEEVPSAENRFDVSPQNVNDDDASEEMPRASVKQSSSDELPGICVENSVIDQGQIVTNEPWLGHFEDQLDDERDDINANQCQQDDAPVFRPRPP